MNKDCEFIIDVLKAPLTIPEKDKLVGAVVLPMTDEEFMEFINNWVNEIGTREDA